MNLIDVEIIVLIKDLNEDEFFFFIVGFKECVLLVQNIALLDYKIH